MKQIILNNEEPNIVVHLESNTVLPGTYVNAEYQQPDDYKIKQLEKIADMVNTTISNANFTSPEQSAAVPLTRDKIKATIITSETGVTYDFNTSKPLQKNVSSYGEVIDHFTTNINKVFVTGATNSKFDIIDKFFPKNNVIKTVENLKNKLPTEATNYTITLNKEIKYDLVVDNNMSRLSITEIKTEEPQKKEKTNLSLSALKNHKISRMVGDPNNDNQAIEIQDDLTDNKLVRLNVKFIIPTLNIAVMILKDDPINKQSEYVLYLDTPNPIKYVDLGDGTSIFTYLRVDDIPDITTNMVLYDGYSEEPKIISEVFIDRGVNNPFERVKKLKNTKNLNELTKIGLGFYKINTKGYNFKNI